MQLYIYNATILSNGRESKILYSTVKILPAIWAGYSPKLKSPAIGWRAGANFQHCRPTQTVKQFLG